jgi:hypothetical protein
MFTSTISNLNLPQIVLAIGSLGTAAYGVVDVSKAFWGGVSNRGFGDIRKVISQFIPAEGNSALSLTSILATLKANWLNGMATGDQKSVAKALIKLNLNPGSAAGMAAATGVDGDVLKSIAVKLSKGASLAPGGAAAPANSLTPEETDAYGRFDLLLSSLLDQGYQRAEQRYRNSAKLLAVPVSVVLAVLGAWALNGAVSFCDSDFWRAIVAGFLATPLAPVAKDVASALQEATKLAQAWKK